MKSEKTGNVAIQFENNMHNQERDKINLKENRNLAPDQGGRANSVPQTSNYVVVQWRIEKSENRVLYS